MLSTRFSAGRCFSLHTVGHLAFSVRCFSAIRHPESQSLMPAQTANIHHHRPAEKKCCRSKSMLPRAWSTARRVTKNKDELRPVVYHTPLILPHPPGHAPRSKDSNSPANKMCTFSPQMVRLRKVAEQEEQKQRHLQRGESTSPLLRPEAAAASAGAAAPPRMMHRSDDSGAAGPSSRRDTPASLSTPRASNSASSSPETVAAAVAARVAAASPTRPQAERSSTSHSAGAPGNGGEGAPGGFAANGGAPGARNAGAPSAATPDHHYFSDTPLECDGVLFLHGLDRRAGSTSPARRGWRRSRSEVGTREGSRPPPVLARRLTAEPSGGQAAAVAAAAAMAAAASSASPRGGSGGGGGSAKKRWHRALGKLRLRRRWVVLGRTGCCACGVSSTTLVGSKTVVCLVFGDYYGCWARKRWANTVHNVAAAGRVCRAVNLATHSRAVAVVGFAPEGMLRRREIVSELFFRVCTSVCSVQVSGRSQREHAKAHVQRAIFLNLPSDPHTCTGRDMYDGIHDQSSPRR